MISLAVAGAQSPVAAPFYIQGKSICFREKRPLFLPFPLVFESKAGLDHVLAKGLTLLKKYCF